MKPQDKVKDAWMPQYQTQAGKNTVMVEIPEIRSFECPVSLLARHPEANSMVYEIRSASAVKEATGATLYGPDTSKWPAKWYEAVLLAEQEKRRVDWAQDDAVKRMTG